MRIENLIQSISFQDFVSDTKMPESDEAAKAAISYTVRGTYFLSDNLVQAAKNYAVHVQRVINQI